MNVSLTTEVEPLKSHDANGCSTNATDVESTQIKLSVEEIKKYQESNLTGPKATRIVIEDKETGKLCEFEVRAILKNGRPALETYPVNGGDNTKLTFGRLQPPREERTVRATGRRVSRSEMLTTGILAAGLFSK